MSQKSFTLIELLIVIAIIGILAGIIIISMSGAQEAANDSRRKADINQLAKVVMIYKTNNPETALPIGTCTIGNTCSSVVFGEANILKDPDGSYYYYSSSDGIDFTIASRLSDANYYIFNSGTGLYSVSEFWVSMLGWTKKVPISINNTSGSGLTNYQVSISIPYSSLKSDCGDLRFTASDGVTELPYWIEECSSSNTKFWVKIPSIPSGINSSFIYAYYGNPSVSTTSNGDQTFELFDHFEGTSLDASKWTKLYTGSQTISSSVLTNLRNGSDVGFISLLSFDNTTAARIKMKNIHSLGSTYMERVYFSGYLFFSDPDVHGGQDGQSVKGRFGNWWGSPYWYVLPLPSGWNNGEYNIVDILREPSQFKVRINGNTSEASTVGYTNGNVRFNATNEIVNNSSSSFDWILFRNYILPEPTTSLGIEENN
ncbi:MAG: hypothetical protein MNSN_00940 [Minisyncoccus archaeiphilus]|jgi:prepilin-type N-terminal cleavage/methylation domain-containing protein|uniref:DUF2341 domain-containing protein n=1 Tax=Minisyncoccus archaeiphilus TaxID=3238481 RepID=UPI002B14486F|nr:MAG: hypothetical protein MNSN_00940 [Candidatus Parcubacteria bacterium]